MDKTKNLRPEKIKMSKLKVYSFLTLSALLMAFAVYNFIVPAQLYIPGLGGVSYGISYTINDILESSGTQFIINNRTAADVTIYWIVYIMANIPIIYFTTKWYSNRFLFLSLYFFVINLLLSFAFSYIPGLNTTLLNIDEYDPNSSALKMAIILSAFIGGIIYGASLGIVFRVGACTMGLDPVAKFVSREMDKNIAPFLFIVTITNTTVWTLIRFFTNPLGFDLTWTNFIQQTLLSPSYIGSWVFVTSYSLITGLIYSSNKKIQIFVTTKKVDQISSYFNEVKFHRGHTIFQTEGGYSKEKTRSFQMIANFEEMYDIVEKIAAIDSKAFITITELKRVYDVRDWRTMTDEDKKKEALKIEKDNKRKKWAEELKKKKEDKIKLKNQKNSF